MLGVIAGVGVFIGTLLVLRARPEVGVTVRPFRPDRLGELATIITLEERVEGGCGCGRVQVGAESWRAVFEGPQPQVGQTVRIVARRHLTLICAPASSAQVPSDIPDPKRGALPRVGARLGRIAAGVLAAGLAVPTMLALTSAPWPVGVGLFGLLAPFMCILTLIFGGNLRSSHEAGLSIRGLRGVIAATCGFATYAAVSVSLLVSLLPLAATLVLAMVDPVLGDALVAIPMLFGGGDG